jgi:hypothetical protein
MDAALAAGRRAPAVDAGTVEKTEKSLVISVAFAWLDTPAAARPVAGTGLTVA